MDFGGIFDTHAINGDFNSSPCGMLQLFQAKQRKKP